MYLCFHKSGNCFKKYNASHLTLSYVQHNNVNNWNNDRTGGGDNFPCHHKEGWMFNGGFKKNLFQSSQLETHSKQCHLLKCFYIIFRIPVYCFLWIVWDLVYLLPNILVLSYLTPFSSNCSRSYISKSLGSHQFFLIVLQQDPNETT